MGARRFQTHVLTRLRDRAPRARHFKPILIEKFGNTRKLWQKQDFADFDPIWALKGDLYRKSAFFKLKSQIKSCTSAIVSAHTGSKDVRNPRRWPERGIARNF